MIVTVEEFLAAGYRREVVDRLPLTAAEIADMTRLVATTDMKARLSSLQGIPPERCFVSQVYRDLLVRALSARP